MRVWRYDPTADTPPTNARPGDIEDRRVVLLAAPQGHSDAVAWMAVDDYDAAHEATLLFAVPPGEQYPTYVNALLGQSIEEARRLGFTSLSAYWRAGWSNAVSALLAQEFTEAVPGVLRRGL